MKKLILFFMTAIFAVSFFTSCEEEEPAQQLSDYVIGEWSSQSIDMDGDRDNYVKFYVDFTEDHYTMQLAPLEEGGIPNWDEAITLPDAGYVVDNEKDMITIDQPQFPGEDPSDETVTFSVEWTEASDVMVWTPLDDEDAPVITWTLQTGI